MAELAAEDGGGLFAANNCQITALEPRRSTAQNI
jgi:hypothetical protein